MRLPIQLSNAPSVDTPSPRSRRPAVFRGHLPWAAASCLWVCSCSGSDSEELAWVGEQQPPVVVVLLDALSAGHLSHLGYPRETTPEMDAIAAEGLSFANCVTPAPYTVASIPSLHTGRLPDAHGVIDSKYRLSGDELTLAEYMHMGGYRTAAAVSSPNGGSSMGNDAGFEEFRELWIPEDESQGQMTERGILYRMPSAADAIENAVELISVEDPRPLFLYLHILEPHTPFQAPPEFKHRWSDPNYAGVFHEDGVEERLLDDLNRKVQSDEVDRAYAHALYDGNLAWADHNVGRLRDELIAADMWEECLFWITSDHGEAQWQHGTWGHNWQLYEEFVRVPLIVKAPHQQGARGVIVEQLVSTIDVLPTIISYLELPELSPFGINGRSILPWMSNPELPDDGRQVLLRSSHHKPDLAMRTQDEKLIARLAPNTPSNSNKIEVYDLSSDPDERVELEIQDREALFARAKLAHKLRAELASNRASQEIQLSERDRLMLEELGYLDE